MVLYLNEEEIIEINRLALESQGEQKDFLLIQPDDLHFVTNFVEKQNTNDYYQLALCYCISLIVLHPFKNGNHRTSLYSAERFLIKNDFSYKGDPNIHLNLQKWRISYEEKNEMERKFFAITILENDHDRTSEMNKLIDSPYGIKIREWLEKYYLKI
jgi:prophage maintenance system killer protein